MARPPLRDVAVSMGAPTCALSNVLSAKHANLASFDHDCHMACPLYALLSKVMTSLDRSTPWTFCGTASYPWCLGHCCWRPLWPCSPVSTGAEYRDLWYYDHVMGPGVTEPQRHQTTSSAFSCRILCNLDLAQLLPVSSLSVLYCRLGARSSRGGASHREGSPEASLSPGV